MLKGYKAVREPCQDLMVERCLLLCGGVWFVFYVGFWLVLCVFMCVVVCCLVCIGVVVCWCGVFMFLCVWLFGWLHSCWMVCSLLGCCLMCV